MTPQTLTTPALPQVRDAAGLTFAALLGLGLLFVASFSQAAVMHDVAHDQRHALAFPCH